MNKNSKSKKFYEQVIDHSSLIAKKVLIPTVYLPSWLRGGLIFLKKRLLFIKKIKTPMKKKQIRKLKKNRFKYK